MPSPGGFIAGLIPLGDQTRADLGRKLREVSDDRGVATEANLDAMARRPVRAHLSPGRIRRGETDPPSRRVFNRT